MSVKQHDVDNWPDWLKPSSKRVTVWQPIDTAPRDGEDTLLLYKPDERRSGETIFAGYWNDEQGFGTGWVPIAGAYRIDRVTHWLPLPPPPREC